MRLPIASPLVSRDGAANKDARLTNMLKESDGGKELAVVRPGLELIAAGTGVGGGLVAFNGELVSVYGTTLGAGVVQTVNVTPSETYADAFFYKVLYVNGEFLSLALDVFEGDNFWASGDGTTFGAQNYLGNANAIRDAATNGTVVVFSDRTLFYSDITEPGNYNFTAPTISIPLIDPFIERVYYVNDRFIALANEDGGTTSCICWSLDGATWEVAAEDTGLLYGAVYDGTSYKFYGSTQLIGGTPLGYETTDFVTFTPLTVSFPGGVSLVYRSAYVPGSYLCYAFDGVNIVLYSSADGETFAAVGAANVTTFDNANNMMAVYGGYCYVIADPLPTDASNFHIFRTANGSTWEDYATLNPTIISSLAIGALNEVGTTDGDEWYSIFDHGSSGSIPALTTIQAGNYDFAQSPL